ncbi:hypothetical protein ACJMK2_037644 [Sinanodonta woodiana]|uniref:Cilia- and flagella-associated protein 36 n=1 Tax=Sinanodonta woodiana TaxID=1069815 RepID=A0ABD3WLH0_SINWO
MATINRAEWVYDELLCFLGTKLFQIPVITFMEANCIIFDPDVNDSSEYKKYHKEYKELVEALLEGFLNDTGLTHKEVIKALTDMNSRNDLRELFQELFEQVLAMDDYVIFVHLMTQKNIELQQQALLLMLKITGSLPDSLRDANTLETPSPSPSQTKSQPREDDDEEIMRKVLEESKKEYISQQKHSVKKSQKEEDALQATIALSKAEVSQLENQKQKEQEKLDMAIASLKIGKPAGRVEPKTTSEKIVAPQPASHTDLRTVPAISVTSVGASSVRSVSEPQKSNPQISSSEPQKHGSVRGVSEPQKSNPQISSSEAAANWMKEAHKESDSSAAHSQALQAAAAALSKLNPEELKKRQEFLRQQRDKLVEMKRKEREQQLLSLEQDQQKRPTSAQVARNALKGEKKSEPAKPNPEEQKKLEMRRAIASKLKAELMGGDK